MFQDILSIVKKELARVFTDRKLVFTTFILPALSLVMIYSIMGMMIKDMQADREKHESRLAIINAPASFENFLTAEADRFNLTAQAGELNQLEGYKKNVHDGELEAIIVFDNQFDEAVKQYKTNHQLPHVAVYYNPTEDYSKEAYGKVRSVIFSEFEKKILTDRFGQAAYLQAFETNTRKDKYEIAPIEKVSGDVFSGFLPMLLSIFLFSGGMGIGIDLIAGEKERGTMATLLVTPIRREAIAFGKIISLGVVSLLSTASSLAGMMLSLPILLGATEGSATASTSGSQLLLMSPIGMIQFLALCVFLTIMYVGVICVVSVYANSIKEAGTLVTPAYLVVMMIGVMTVFTTGQPGVLECAIPLYGCLMAMKLALTGELSWLMFGATALSSSVIIVGIVILIRHMFNSEKIMFGA